VPAGAAGGAPRRYLATGVRSDPRLPAADNAVATWTLQRAGSELHTLVLVQRHGAVLDNLYVTQPEPIADADISTAVGVATPTGKRLA
jgi:hypothetical protein